MAANDKATVYTASRVRHSLKWIYARENGVHIISTWIDESGEGQSPSMSDLWERCIDESKTANALILYREGDEPLKGALVEVGAALGAGHPVFAVGFDEPGDLKMYSFLNHRLVTRCSTLKAAFLLAAECGGD